MRFLYRPHKHPFLVACVSGSAIDIETARISDDLPRDWIADGLPIIVAAGHSPIYPIATLILVGEHG